MLDFFTKIILQSQQTEVTFSNHLQSIFVCLANYYNLGLDIIFLNI